MARTLYQKFRDLWKDKPDKTTPVTAEALNHIERGIYDNSDRMALKEIYNDDGINLEGKAYISDDVITGKASLNGLSASLISTAADISAECIVNVSGQTLTITVPIDGIFINAPFWGGCYVGKIDFSGLPSYLFRAQISTEPFPNFVLKGVVKLDIIATEAHAFSSVIEGKIQNIYMTAPPTSRINGAADMVFDLNFPTTPIVSDHKIFKALPIEDLNDKIESLEQRIAELESAE